MRWFDEEQEPSPFLKALEEVRRMATREGWRYQHVQAIIVAIDQYAETATGNRDFRLYSGMSVHLVISCVCEVVCALGGCDGVEDWRDRIVDGVGGALCSLAKPML